MNSLENLDYLDLSTVDWQSSRSFFAGLKKDLTEALEDHGESYNFTWVGKRNSMFEAAAPISKILRPAPDQSQDFNTTENLLIVGDNLDALKLLQAAYYHQVKLIYIDPPYNTGHDLIYHDNFTIKKSDYQDATTSGGAQAIAEDKFTENFKASGRFHSDWLSMMYPRLKLAYNLLADDGVIFISIGEDEQANLKKLCDEIFNEANCIAQIVNKTPNQTADTNKKQVHEYILVYCRNILYGKLLAGEKIIQSARCTTGKEDQTMPTIEFAAGIPVEGVPDGEYTSPRQLGGNEDIELVSGQLVVEHGCLKYPVQLKARWSNPNDLRAYMAKWKSGSTDPIYNKFGKELTKLYLKGLRFLPIMEKVGYDDIESVIEITSKGSSDLKKLGLEKYFPYPKSVALIKKLLSLGPSHGPVLDFFAGSGTTGQAVMELNAADGGHRQFILVQLDEPTAKHYPEAHQAGFTTIDQITAERLRRAGASFRLFHLDSANENPHLRQPLSAITQSSLLDAIDNLKPDRTPLDLLFGVVYASALPFHRPLTARQVGDNTIYLYDYLGQGTGLAACFDAAISEDTIKAIAALQPLTAAFRDATFPDSAAKINLAELFRTLSPATRIKIL